MPAKLVPTVRTQYNQYELTRAFIEGWKELYGNFPEKKQVAVIWAQNALETGMSASMWCNNIGNVKYVAQASDDESIQYCMLGNTWEIINGKKVIFQPPHPATWFRAFATLREGVLHHFGFLKNKRYKIAWPAVEAGDPAQFAHLLRVQGYYTAPEADYVKAEMAYFNKFMKADYFEKSMAEINKPIIDQPIIHPPIEFDRPEPVISDDGPLKAKPTFWQKLTKFFGR